MAGEIGTLSNARSASSSNPLPTLPGPAPTPHERLPYDDYHPPPAASLGSCPSHRYRIEDILRRLATKRTDEWIAARAAARADSDGPDIPLPHHSVFEQSLIDERTRRESLTSRDKLTLLAAQADRTPDQIRYVPFLKVPHEYPRALPDSGPLCPSFIIGLPDEMLHDEYGNMYFERTDAYFTAQDAAVDRGYDATRIECAPPSEREQSLLDEIKRRESMSSHDKLVMLEARRRVEVA